MSYLQFVFICCVRRLLTNQPNTILYVLRCWKASRYFRQTTPLTFVLSKSIQSFCFLAKYQGIIRSFLNIMIFEGIENVSSDDVGLKSFYDNSLRQTLLVRGKSSSVWPHSSGTKYTQNKLHPFYNDPVLTTCTFARISLDFSFLACQTSSTQVVVIDTKQHQKYNITIKTSSSVLTNRILPNGLIWSDHGGGSQDLIVVTQFGLELYKVSAGRRQCKLSRTVSEYSPQALLDSFWYDPTCRLVVLLYIPAPAGLGDGSKGLLSYLSRSMTSASPIASESSSASKRSADTNQHFYVGYYLNQETPGLPALELPPPEKMQNFISFGKQQLGYDVKLFSVYGSSYCATLFLLAEKYFVGVFALSKTGSSLECYLSLERVQNRDYVAQSALLSFEVSVVDNLLVVHILPWKTSALFDIHQDVTDAFNLPGLGEDKESVRVLQPVFISPIRLDNSSTKALSTHAMDAPEPSEVANQPCWQYETSQFGTACSFSGLLLVTHSSIERSSCTNHSLRVDLQVVCAAFLQAAPASSSTSGCDSIVPNAKFGAMDPESFLFVVSFLLRRGATDPGLEQAAKRTLFSVLLDVGKCNLSSAFFRSVFAMLCKVCTYSSSASMDSDLLATLANANLDAAAAVDFEGRSTTITSQHVSSGHRTGELMAISQAELARHFFLPLCRHYLSAGTSESCRFCDFLIEFVSILRTRSDPDGSPSQVDPTLCLLLFRLLVRNELYPDFASLVHAQVFPDSTELASAILEHSASLREREKMLLQQSTTTSVSPLTAMRNRGAASCLQQIGVDMLWRLQKTGTLAHWLAHHGNVFEATRLRSFASSTKRPDEPGELFPSDMQVGEAEAVLGVTANKYDYETLYSLHLHLQIQ